MTASPRRSSPDGTRRGVVLVHGFGGSPATFGPLADRLRSQGIAVRAVTWRSDQASWDSWVDAVDREVTRIAGARGGVVLVGQSAGAALATAVASGRHDVVEALVLLNPLVIPMDDDTLEFLDGRLARGGATVAAEPVGVVDPSVTDPDAAGHLDLAGLLVLHRELAAVWARAGQGRIPVAVLRGEADDIVGPDHAAALSAQLPRAAVTTIAGGHLAALDAGRDTVLETVLSATRVVRRDESGGRLGSPDDPPGDSLRDPSARSTPEQAEDHSSRSIVSRILAAAVVVALVGGSCWFAVRAFQLFLESRAEAEAFRRLGTCEVLDPQQGSVTCTGVVLGTVRLPSTFAVCRRWQDQGGDCIVEVHERARPAFVAAIDELDREGLGDLVTEFGTVNRRMCRDALTGGWRDGCISRHSYGIAVDVRAFADNARWGELVAAEPRLGRLVQVFEAAGFRWGGDFSNNVDPQHFEWKPR